MTPRYKNDNQAPPPGYEHRKGAWVQTYTGKPFWPTSPRVEDIDELDIAHALSNQCRFAGHCQTFYSVAEHSVRVSLVLRDEGEDVMTQLWGLLHDAPEAYLVDLPRPVKHAPGIGKGYQAVEARLMQVVCQKYGLPLFMPDAVEAADMRLLETEARDLMWTSGSALWSMGVEPLEEVIHPFPPPQVKAGFLVRLYELTGRDPEVLFAKDDDPAADAADQETA